MSLYTSRGSAEPFLSLFLSLLLASGLNLFLSPSYKVVYCKDGKLQLSNISLSACTLVFLDPTNLTFSFSLFLQALRVCVTGAAGQIGYALLYSIASGGVFGPEQVFNTID